MQTLLPSKWRSVHFDSDFVALLSQLHFHMASLAERHFILAEAVHSDQRLQFNQPIATNFELAAVRYEYVELLTLISR